MAVMILKGPTLGESQFHVISNMVLDIRSEGETKSSFKEAT